jgi:hypothetical protein
MDLQPLQGLPFATLSAAMLSKLLGPTAQYLGGKSKELTEKMVVNLEQVFQDFAKKVGEKINERGEVPPRVLKGIVSEGAFCEDRIAAGYLGGVLASSRSDAVRDDRGVVMNALISRLSVYQLRTHYIIYHAIKDLLDGTGVDLNKDYHHQTTVMMPYLTYVVAMGFHNNEMSEEQPFSDDAMHAINSIFEHTFFGLHKEALIGSFEYHYGEDAGFTFSPSHLGVELFMWAYGYGAEPTYRFLNSSLKFEQNDDVMLIPGYNPHHQQHSDDKTFIIPGYRLKGHGIGLSCPQKEAKE